jgi:esterase/lipase superfamily enzyme
MRNELTVPAAGTPGYARRWARLAGITLTASMLIACTSQLALMPTPEVLKDPRFDVFAANPTPLNTNEITTYYVTNRTQAGATSQGFFTGKPDNALHFGYATVRLGPTDLDIQKLLGASTTEGRDEKLEWTVVRAPILASQEKPEDADRGHAPRSLELTPDLETFFAELNGAVDASLTRKLTVYAHGANNKYNWSVSQGAQYQYFTGNNEVMLTFSWPSPGRISGYRLDKSHANESSADFAYLLELLAEHSTAVKINVIGFSAGGRVVGGALGLLGGRHKDPADLRLGQVYLASSDEPLKDFVTALPIFYPLVDAVTVTANPGDPVLRLARMTDAQVRLGAPGRTSGVESLDLTDAESARLKEMINSDRLTILDLSRNLIEGFEFSHGAWYENPWVSTDALVYILDGLRPQDRGLDSYESELGYQIWFFPADYLDRVAKALLMRSETN